MKGQLYLMAAIVIVITLVTIKTSLNLIDLLENKRALESGLERLEFQNLRGELLRVAVNTLNSSANVTANTASFIQFAKTAFQTRSTELQGIGLITVYPTVAASTDVRYNVSIINFFDRPIDTINLNFSYDATKNQTFSNVDPGVIDMNFTFNTAAHRNYTLWVYYRVGTEEKIKNITVSVEVGKSKFVEFFDVRMKSERLEQRDDVSETFPVP